MLKKRPDVSAINSTDIWASGAMPNLGLVAEDAFEFRVYVLRCKPKTASTPGPFYYVGFEHRAKLKHRIGLQFSGGQNAAYYCKQNKPECIELVWPAAGRAVEAYVFHALLAMQQAGWERKGSEGLCPLGGVDPKRCEDVAIIFSGLRAGAPGSAGYVLLQLRRPSLRKGLPEAQARLDVFVPSVPGRDRTDESW